MTNKITLLIITFFVSGCLSQPKEKVNQTKPFYYGTWEPIGGLFRNCWELSPTEETACEKAHVIAHYTHSIRKNNMTLFSNSKLIESIPIMVKDLGHQHAIITREDTGEVIEIKIREETQLCQYNRKYIKMACYEKKEQPLP